MPLIIAALLLGMAGASINYVANRWAPRSLARVILALSILPIAGLLIYSGVELGLAIETNDMRYLGADMAFGIVLIATFILVPSACLGARLGRRTVPDPAGESQR